MTHIWSSNIFSESFLSESFFDTWFLTFDEHLTDFLGLHFVKMECGAWWHLHGALHIVSSHLWLGGDAVLSLHFCVCHFRYLTDRCWVILTFCAPCLTLFALQIAFELNEQTLNILVMVVTAAGIKCLFCSPIQIQENFMLRRPIIAMHFLDNIFQPFFLYGLSIF